LFQGEFHNFSRVLLLAGSQRKGNNKIIGEETQGNGGLSDTINIRSLRNSRQGQAYRLVQNTITPISEDIVRHRRTY
jgi:hypothetical protein